MLDAVELNPIHRVWSAARLHEPGDALVLASETLTGRSGFPVLGHHVMHDIASSRDLINITEPDISPRLVETMCDPVLDVLGLKLSRVASCNTTSSAAEQVLPLVLALRLGLLARSLDLAFHHLEHRESFGQKLLHHQMIKSRFATSWATVARLREELVLSQQTGYPLSAEPILEEITSHATQVAKLMGGHGFRAGSLHSLEYLSLLLAAMVTPCVAGRT